MTKNEALKSRCFSGLTTPPAVDPRDLNSLHYYRDAAKTALERAEREQEKEEKLRLLEKVKWHLQKVDMILAKYEEGSWFRA
jgi:CCR4-NOT transcriptional regulation complex NOT5 subunit